jgi:hypothetical protein
MRFSVAVAVALAASADAAVLRARQGGDGTFATPTFQYILRVLFIEDCPSCRRDSFPNQQESIYESEVQLANLIDS